MAAETYPKDSIGMPLPVLIPELPNGASAKWNRHHAWFFARRFLLGTPADQVLRYSRLQYIPVRLHNRLHKKYGEGVEKPIDDQKKWQLTLLGMAGYVPEEGIRFSKYNIEKVELGPNQLERLRKTGAFTVEATRSYYVNGQEFKPQPTIDAQISTYFLDYIMRNGLHEVRRDKEYLIDKYINASSAHTRENIAQRIIRLASEVAVEPVEAIYSQARTSQRLRNCAPRSAQRVVWGVMKQEIPDLSGYLKDVLQLDYDIPDLSEYASRYEDTYSQVPALATASQ